MLQSGIYGDVPEKYAYSEVKKEARLAQQQLMLHRLAEEEQYAGHMGGREAGAMNWPPGDVPKTKLVRVSFFCTPPSGRGSTPPRPGGWGRAAASLPGAAAAGSPVGSVAMDVDGESRLVPNWPPGHGVEKTKHVAVRFHVGGAPPPVALGGAAVLGLVPAAAPRPPLVVPPTSEGWVQGASVPGLDWLRVAADPAARAPTRCEAWSENDWWNAFPTRIFLNEARREGKVFLQYEGEIYEHLEPHQLVLKNGSWGASTLRAPVDTPTPPVDDAATMSQVRVGDDPPEVAPEVVKSEPIAAAQPAWGGGAAMQAAPPPAAAPAKLALSESLKERAPAPAALKVEVPQDPPAAASPANGAGARSGDSLGGTPLSGLVKGLVRGLDAGSSGPASGRPESARAKEALPLGSPAPAPAPAPRGWVNPCFWPMYFTRWDGLKLRFKKCATPPAYTKLCVFVGHADRADASSGSSWRRDFALSRSPVGDEASPLSSAAPTPGPGRATPASEAPPRLVTMSGADGAAGSSLPSARSPPPPPLPPY